MKASNPTQIEMAEAEACSWKFINFHIHFDEMHDMI